MALINFFNQPRKFFFAIVFFLLLFPCILFGQNKTENIFVYLSGQYYIIPDVAGVISPDMAEKYGVSKGIIPYPGFRTGAGYEWNRWSFALESGFTYIKGDNPLVLDINLIPLLLKTGYTFYPIVDYDRFSLTPTLGAGLVFAWVDHYKDVIDMLTDRKTHSSNRGFLAQTGVRAGWNPNRQWDKAIELFAGLSVDLIIETGGIIPLPQVEIGVLLRPWRFVRSTEAKPEETIEGFKTVIQEPEPELIRHIWLVLFPPNSTIPTAEGNTSLDRAGAALAAILKDEGYSGLSIILRGYAAPFASASGQQEISRVRVLYCAAMLKEKYGIPEDAISVQWYGAQITPEDTDEASHPRRRSVEIILVGKKQQ